MEINSRKEGWGVEGVVKRGLTENVNLSKDMNSGGDEVAGLGEHSRQPPDGSILLFQRNGRENGRLARVGKWERRR